jgi:carbon storage regulator CsrA
LTRPRTARTVRKLREAVVIGGSDGIERLMKVTVLEINRGSVRLGFEAAAEVPVHRGEVWERIQSGLPDKASGDFD